MATNAGAPTERSEFCEHCGRETIHSVSLQLVTESDRSDNAEFSREPYRVTECLVCGEQTAVRMNNA
ncbi:DUF7835 family putative zinc beta-ribbon protein [Halapricum desulfuricans]|uniref:Zn finger protein, C2H2 type n=1 Tax=Halapricum desulfuricans TaxID=2841257 RepID=A0A897NKB4_9EURY|nr:hypothetical protein [Halapricum desulfuricans]QSG08956.1 Zn finger protein, C2H2 type [Halapricum desulfuricans]QSG11885.1 Zn finger protein, C2H2 type [Halapricum desulfuricans]